MTVEDVVAGTTLLSFLAGTAAAEEEERDAVLASSTSTSTSAAASSSSGAAFDIVRPTSLPFVFVCRWLAFARPRFTSLLCRVVTSSFPPRAVVDLTPPSSVEISREAACGGTLLPTLGDDEDDDDDAEVRSSCSCEEGEISGALFVVVVPTFPPPSASFLTAFSRVTRRLWEAEVNNHLPNPTWPVVLSDDLLHREDVGNACRAGRTAEVVGREHCGRADGL